MRMEPSLSLSLCQSRHHNSPKRSVVVHMHGLERWPKCARARARIVRVRVRKNFSLKSLHLSAKRLFFVLLSTTNNKQKYGNVTKIQEFFTQILAFCLLNVFSLYCCLQQTTNKSMDKLQKFELCVVFIDRNGKSYECFVPILGPASFLSLEGSTSKQEIPFEMWISNRLSKWLRASYVACGDISVAVSRLHDFVYAPLFSVKSYDDLTQLGYRVLSLVMRQIF